MFYPLHVVFLFSRNEATSVCNRWDNFPVCVSNENMLQPGVKWEEYFQKKPWNKKHTYTNATPSFHCMYSLSQMIFLERFQESRCWKYIWPKFSERYFIPLFGLAKSICQHEMMGGETGYRQKSRTNVLCGLKELCSNIECVYGFYCVCRTICVNWLVKWLESSTFENKKH